MRKVSLAAQIGFVSAVMAITAIAVYMVCFFAILVANPLTVWSTFETYVAQQQAYNQSFKYVAQATMLLFPLLYLLMVNCVHDQTPVTQSVLTRAACLLALGFAILAGMHYWVQISAVRLNLNKSTTDGLIQFIQAKPDSALAAINMLGWTVFFGLSQLLSVGRRRLPARQRRVGWTDDEPDDGRLHAGAQRAVCRALPSVG